MSDNTEQKIVNEVRESAIDHFNGCLDICGDDVLLAIANTLDAWAAVSPSQGTYKHLCSIMSEELIKYRTTNQTLTKQVERLKAENSEYQEALGVLGNAVDRVSKKLHIIQPFLSIWKKYGTVINKAMKPTT